MKKGAAEGRATLSDGRRPSVDGRITDFRWLMGKVIGCRRLW